MKADQARMRDLLTQTIKLMCRNGLDFSRELRVEGLLAVTVDSTDIFLIHMDEIVTDRPSYAAGSQGSESIAGRQQRDSASSPASDADEISVDHLNDCIHLPSSSAVNDVSERSCSFHAEDVHLVKTEANAEDSDSDDVMIVESDVRSLISSNIPLPVVQEMDECEDSSHMPFSPVDKRRRISQKRTSCGDVRASVGTISGDADLWTRSPLCAPRSTTTYIPSTRDTISHHAYDSLQDTSLLRANESQSLVRS